MNTLSIDFETRSTVDLKKSGVQPYAEHPTTDIWLMAWAFDGEEPEVWYPPHALSTLATDGAPPAAFTSELPARVVEHILAGGEIRAWNAGFEKVIWREVMVKRYRAPKVKLEQWADTMAEAAAMALPRSLEECAGVCGTAHQKDPDGYRLMLRMARPRKIDKDTGEIIWWDDPERIHRLAEYAKQDVRAERALVPAVRRLVPRERQLWLFDQKINDRGIRLDIELVRAAQDIADEGARRAGAALEQLTKGRVATVTDLNGFKRWLADQGVAAPSLAKKAMRELFDTELPIHVREVLQIRQEVGKASVAKLRAMVDAVAADGRFHGLLRYHGASTGRWAGALVQPQNFPRGELDEKDDVENYIPLVLGRDFDSLGLLYPPVIIIMSMLRSMLIADPGHDFISADYIGIEARTLAWLAGQDDLTEAFVAGIDVYKLAASKTYGVPIEQVTKQQRQMGKFQILGLGFGMGAEKGVTTAKDMFGLTVSEEQMREIVKRYRDKNDKIVTFWRDAKNAVLSAVERPGVVVPFGDQGRLKATKRGSYLYIVLPSGRPLAYAAPKIVEAEMPWSTPERPVFRPSVEFSGFDSRPGALRRWSRLRLYGGLIAENVTQAVARDIMAEGMLRVEDAGYPVVLTVHDEVVSEVPENRGTLEEYERVLSVLPPWATGLPVKAEGWRSKRYRK